MNRNELFEANPNRNTSFPFVYIVGNDHDCYPKRLHFQQLHYHDDLQITYVVKGSVKIQTLNTYCILKEREACFINKRALHQILQLEDVEYKTFLFPKEMILGLKGSQTEKDIQKCIEMNDLEIFKIEEPTILKLIGELNNIMVHKDLYTEFGVMAYLTMIMYQLLKVIPVIHHHYDHTLIEDSIIYIHMNYASPISLQDIADSSHISTSYLGKLFKEALSTTPYEYLIDYRIEKSLELLKNHSLTITEIALSVGFNDTSNYVQSFKRRLNVTPKQYALML